MSHYPTYEREAFLDWIDADMPDVATIEEDHEPREVSAEQLLRRFMLPEPCTDTMPRQAAAEVAGACGYDGDASGLPYGLAAAMLLILRTSGTTPASAFADALLAPMQAAVAE